MALNSYQAAQRVRAYLIERYGLEDEPEINLPTVWTKQRSDESGWEYFRGCVNLVWEGGNEWPYEISDAQYAGKLDLPGVFTEPATSYALSFYPDR